MNAPGGPTNVENYARAALEGEVRKVAAARPSERNAMLNTAAFCLGQLVGAGSLSESEVTAALERAAGACGLTRDDGARAASATIKGALAKGIASPREVSARNDDARSEGGGRHRVTGAPARDYVACTPSEARTKPGSFPNWTTPGEAGKPTFHVWDGQGPGNRSGEVRRHVYKQGGIPLRIKIRNQDGTDPRFVDWYRVTNDRGEIGWQAKKPACFRDVPYVGEIDPFDRELEGDVLYWPEGEKDVDSVTRLGLPALTFGGTSALPQGAEEFCRGRHVVILVDNDLQGRRHAQEKAEVTYGVAASVKVIHFPELPVKGDVSDYFASGGSADDLRRRSETASHWTAQEPRLAIVPTPFIWHDPRAIAPRQWLSGRHLIRRFVSATIAPGGIGKSMLITADSLAMASGRNLLGDAPACALCVLDGESRGSTRRIRAADFSCNAPLRD